MPRLMPKGPYTPTHRLLLQVIMWVIFGLCMGMAGLMTAQRRAAFSVAMTPQKLGPFEVKLPTKWKPNPNLRSALPVVDAEEPTDLQRSRYPRRFTVYAERLAQPMNPDVYLLTRPQVGYETRSGILWLFGQKSDQKDISKQFEPYKMLGVTGVQAAKVDTEGLLRVFACAVVPDPKDNSINWAVTVRFLGDEEYPPADRAVFRQVTDSITFAKD
jgi:hypothetical protein